MSKTTCCRGGRTPPLQNRLNNSFVEDNFMNRNNNTLIAFDKDSSKEYQLAARSNFGYAWDPKIVRKTVDIELSIMAEEVSALSDTLDAADEPGIEIQGTDDGFMLMSVGNKTYPVEIVSCRQNEYEVLVNGVSYSFSIETGFSLQRRKMLDTLAAQSSNITIKAPIPGVVIEVLVKPGDVVKAGDTLIILEAMKMQNAILASTKGVITKIYAGAGDSVNQRDVLIDLGKDA